jgi:hypothetical protein
VAAGATPEATAGFQGVSAAGGTVAAGATVAHPVTVDAVTSALFLLFGDQDALSFALVDPDGTRIDPSTSDGYLSYPDDEALPHAGFAVDAPSAGLWTLEVTGGGQDAAYGVVTLVPMAPDGIVLSVSLDRDVYTAGSAVTFTARVTSGDATVAAVVLQPDGVTTVPVILTPEGAGAFTAGDAGEYTIAVTAAGPAFTREAVVRATVTRSATGLTRVVGDRGVGAGLFDERRRSSTRRTARSSGDGGPSPICPPGSTRSRSSSPPRPCSAPATPVRTPCAC